MIRICSLELVYVVFLCFLRRNSRIANILKTKLAVFFIYKGVVIRLMNFLEGSHFEKFFVCDSVQEIKSYRSVVYVPHCRKKCFLSSIDSGQKGQNLMFLFFRWCLPFSISREWFDSRSLVRAVLCLIFSIWLKYFSYPICVLNKLYVRSLLASLLISWNVFWWKMSVSRWNAAICVLSSLFRNLFSIPIPESVSYILFDHNKLLVMQLAYEILTSSLHVVSLLILTQFFMAFLVPVSDNGVSPNSSNAPIFVVYHSIWYLWY